MRVKKLEGLLSTTDPLSAARLICLLGVVGAVCSLLFWPQSTGHVVTAWQYFWLMGVSLISLLALRKFKSHSVAVSYFFISIIVANSIFSGVVTNLELAKSGLRYEAFAIYKVAPLVLAMLAPPAKRAGYVLIIMVGLAAVFTYYVLIPSEYLKNVLAPEPWMSVFYAVVALFIYRHRVRETQIEREAIQAIEQKNGADERARAFSAIRDLSNTPLQILELTASQLKIESPGASEKVKRLEYGIARLKELNEILESYEVEPDRPMKGLSFDSMEVLQRKSRGH